MPPLPPTHTPNGGLPIVPFSAAAGGSAYAMLSSSTSAAGLTAAQLSGFITADAVGDGNLLNAQVVVAVHRFAVTAVPPDPSSLYAWSGTDSDVMSLDPSQVTPGNTYVSTDLVRVSCICVNSQPVPVMTDIYQAVTAAQPLASSATTSFGGLCLNICFPSSAGRQGLVAVAVASGWIFEDTKTPFRFVASWTGVVG
jgi:hypothetical protein